MSYPRIGEAGLDFTVTKYNSMVDMLEMLGIQVLGKGVVSGLVITQDTGLELAISDGMFLVTSCVELASIPNFLCPSNDSFYVWIDEDGVVSSTASSEGPGGNVVCLGYVTTSGTDITQTTSVPRQELVQTLQGVSQAGGYEALDLSSGSIVLTKEQYGKRILEFTGELTEDVTVTVPARSGFMWKFVNSTTGAFTVTVVDEEGVGQEVVQDEILELWTDGIGIRTAGSTPVEPS